MAISYLKAIAIVLEHASPQRPQFEEECEEMCITKATGRVCSQEYRSTFSSPAFDTSAMDGYAVNSNATRGASPDNPLILRVQGTIAAGDAPLLLDGNWHDGCLPCAEIMTGAQFPNSICKTPFDACIKHEDTTIVSVPDREEEHVQIRKPAKSNQNRRPAGNDFQVGELIIRAGSTIEPQHAMTFGSLGVKVVRVYRRLRMFVIF
jgi:molybdopterin biosynthesis enzyme